MKPHPFGTRDAVITDLGGVGAAGFVMAFADNDPVVFAAGLLLAAVHVLLLVLVLARPGADWHFNLQRHLSTPIALTVSLVVCARLLPEHVYFIALYWVLFASLFNFLLFRSRALNAFLAVYLVVAAGVSFAVVTLPPFLTGSLLFLSLVTGYVLAYQGKVLTTMKATLASKEGEVARAALVDRLAGLPNRQSFLDRLSGTLRPAQRRGQNVLVIAVDIDEWAALRERLGNPGVVSLLGAVSSALSSAVQVLGVSGSDRILIAVSAVGDDDAQVQRTLDQCPREHVSGVDRHQVSVTAGYSRFPDDGDEPDILVLRAEEAALAARQDARGRVRRFNATESATRREQHALEQELRLAVDQQQFMLLYQPKVDRTGTVRGCEALIRWNHPERRMIGPATSCGNIVM